MKNLEAMLNTIYLCGKGRKIKVLMTIALVSDCHKKVTTNDELARESKFWLFHIQSTLSQRNQAKI